MTTEHKKRFVPLSKAAHAQVRWRPIADWRFAAAESMVSLSGFELPRAAGNFPVVFVRARDRVETVALLGLKRGENLFVNANGEWVGDYVPATLRSRPFVLGASGEGQTVLCMDEASPLIVADGSGEGERVFGDGGELTPPAQKVADFLRSISGGLLATTKASDALWRHNCLEPLRVPESLAASLQHFKGLHQVNEAALRALPAESLAELMALGAIGMAYAHMISLHKLSLLARLAELRARESAPPAAPDLSLLERDGTLVFGSLG
jgi:hypothetical protein